jgi:hypothetical protein
MNETKTDPFKFCYFLNPGFEFARVCPQFLNHKRKKWRQKSKRKKANIAPRCFWGWLLRTWHEDFLSSFEKQQQKELFPASHTWRKSRHKTHTHTRNSCVLSNSCHWGCAFSLIPVVVILGAFFLFPPKFQPEKNCLKWRHWFDNAGYYNWRNKVVLPSIEAETRTVRA